MQIHVRLFGHLRHHLPDEQRGKTTLQITSGTTVQSVLDALQLDEPLVIAINDEQAADNDTILSEGDTVLIFEPASGG